jgi:hypothetical protein
MKQKVKAKAREKDKKAKVIGAMLPKDNGASGIQGS